jgi:hypothetical protein
VQRGVHPRIGATDVIPFVPVSGISLAQCAILARQAGLEIWSRYNIPIYFYEAAASTTASGGPAMVTTERLWSVSMDQSSKETPSTRMASTIACTFLRSQPSEKLGTHSMTVSFIRLPALGPGYFHQV